MDVITNAIIYKPAAVDRVGAVPCARHQSGAGEAFDNAREPLGQAFKPSGGGEPFLVVVNHFKSKGSAGPRPGDADTGDGQGASNESRVRQATALRDWVPDVPTDDRAVEAVFLAGDFNSYTGGPAAGPVRRRLHRRRRRHGANDETPTRSPACPARSTTCSPTTRALARVTGADIWNINSRSRSPSSTAATTTTASSSTGTTRTAPPTTTPVICRTRGRRRPDRRRSRSSAPTTSTAGSRRSTAAGAAAYAGGEELREANPNTVFAAAGDLVGASTFESSSRTDKPTIDAMNCGRASRCRRRATTSSTGTTTSVNRDGAVQRRHETRGRRGVRRYLRRQRGSGPTTRRHWTALD